MAFLGINNFVDAFKDGLRPNLFYVQLGNIPTGDKGNSNVTGGLLETFDTAGNTESTDNGWNKLHFFCKAASIPASSIASVEVPFMGRSIKVAGNRTFEDWTITVYNAVHTGGEGATNNTSLRLMFEQWMAYINSHDHNTGYNRIVSYKTDAKIAQLDQKGNSIASYVIQGIFPTEVSSIDLAWDSNDTIEEFTVTFAIGNYWTVENDNVISNGVGASAI